MVKGQGSIVKGSGYLLIKATEQRLLPCYTQVEFTSLNPPNIGGKQQI